MRLALALIILLSCSLAAHRAVNLPLLQGPDEISHIDYAFSIYSAGRLLNVRQPASGMNTKAKAYSHEWERITHLWTQHLVETTDYERVMERTEKAPAVSFAHIDKTQPGPGEPGEAPWLLNAYPFGYYAALALWLKLTSPFTHGPATQLIAARLFSVLLLSCSLLLTYALCRKMRLGEVRSLAVTAVAGLFPLTTYTASAVQPDNLSLTLVLLCLALGNRPKLLGLSLGALLVTKYHVYACVAPCVALPYLVRRRWRDLALILSPGLPLFIIQLWVTWGGPITGQNLQYGYSGLRSAWRDFYGGGYAFQTYFSSPHGWDRLSYRTAFILRWSVLAVAALVIVRLGRGWVGIVKRGSLRLSNPVWTSHFVYTALMFTLYAVTRNSFVAQGRHFYPFFVTGLLLAVEYAPRAFRERRVRNLLSLAILAGLFAWCLYGGYHLWRADLMRY